MQVGEEIILEYLVKIEVDALLAHALHQVRVHSLVKTPYAFLAPGSAGKITQGLVFLRIRAGDLALLDARPQSSDGIGEENRENLAQRTTDEVLFAQGRLGEPESVV